MKFYRVRRSKRLRQESVSKIASSNSKEPNNSNSMRKTASPNKDATNLEGLQPSHDDDDDDSQDSLKYNLSSPPLYGDNCLRLHKIFFLCKDLRLKTPRMDAPTLKAYLQK